MATPAPVPLGCRSSRALRANTKQPNRVFRFRNSKVLGMAQYPKHLRRSTRKLDPDLPEFHALLRPTSHTHPHHGLRLAKIRKPKPYMAKKGFWQKILKPTSQ